MSRKIRSYAVDPIMPTQSRAIEHRHTRDQLSRSAAWSPPPSTVTAGSLTRRSAPRPPQRACARASCSGSRWEPVDPRPLSGSVLENVMRGRRSCPKRKRRRLLTNFRSSARRSGTSSRDEDVQTLPICVAETVITETRSLGTPGEKERGHGGHRLEGIVGIRAVRESAGEPPRAVPLGVRKGRRCSRINP